MYKTPINQFLNFFYLFLTYFFVDSLGISHNAPQFHSSSSLSYLPLIPEVSPSKENLKKSKSKTSKQTKGEKNPFAPPSFLRLQHLFIYPSGTGSPGVSHSTPFCTISFTFKCSLQQVIGLLQGLWFLVLHHP